MTTQTRELEISAALGSLDTAEALEVLRELGSQPRSIGDLAYRLEATKEQIWEVVTPLVSAGMIELWGASAWRLTPLGAEVWTAVSELLAPSPQPTTEN